MNVDEADIAVASIAASIAEPARARILYSLLDGRARTATELSVVAEVSPSTTSAHLRRLETHRLVRVLAQGKHRYYSLANENVADALEALSVVAGCSREAFVNSAPARLRAARTCYDHLAGTLGVRLHDRLRELKWLRAAGDRAYEITPAGATGLQEIGVDVDGARALRRRFATACLDWSERRDHLAGALGAALLATALKKKWIVLDLDSRIVTVTPRGRWELKERLGVVLP